MLGSLSNDVTVLIGTVGIKGPLITSVKDLCGAHFDSVQGWNSKSRHIGSRGGLIIGLVLVVRDEGIRMLAGWACFCIRGYGFKFS